MTCALLDRSSAELPWDHSRSCHHLAHQLGLDGQRWSYTAGAGCGQTHSPQGLLCSRWLAQVSACSGSSLPGGELSGCKTSREDTTQMPHSIVLLPSVLKVNHSDSHESMGRETLHLWFWSGRVTLQRVWIQEGKALSWHIFNLPYLEKQTQKAGVVILTSDKVEVKVKRNEEETFHIDKRTTIRR